MAAFDDLLRVQEYDTSIDQLRHRRLTLPERADVTKVEEELATLERSFSEVGGRRDDVARRQKHAEDELASVEAKISEVRTRMYSGEVTIPRELQAMQAEIESLDRRRSTLEDEVLEAMTDREPLDEEIGALDAARASLDADGARLRAAIAEAEAAIDDELARAQAARDQLFASIPGDLAKLYDQLRSRLGGVGAARLINGRCSGCHLTLPAIELDRIRHEPPDTLIRCDQCGRILVR